MRLLTDARAASECFLTIVHKSGLILMAGVGEEKGKNSAAIRAKKEKETMGVRPWVTGLQPRRIPSQVLFCRELEITIPPDLMSDSP